MTEYKRIKLSVQDKSILRDIYDELEKITLRKSFCGAKPRQGHQLRIGTYTQKNAYQGCFGLTVYQGKRQASYFQKKHPHMMVLFKKFIQSHNPSFEFKSVYVNKNVVCDKHKDSLNMGTSLLVGVGDYKGGQSMLNVNGKTKKFSIKSSSIMFNGTEIEHWSLPFEGTRYSLVFFN
tara:strand:+ start:298 stop:828 length:531 start_codon:yes stop_codon:yes gene_type:complete